MVSNLAHYCINHSLQYIATLVTSQINLKSVYNNVAKGLFSDPHSNVCVAGVHTANLQPAADERAGIKQHCAKVQELPNISDSGHCQVLEKGAVVR